MRNLLMHLETAWKKSHPLMSPHCKVNSEDSGTPHVKNTWEVGVI